MEPERSGPDAELRFLRARVRHLTNELALAREECDNASRNYYELHAALEGKVAEKNRELREMYGKLKEKHRLLEVILDSSPGMIYFKDEKRRFVEVNRMFARAFGLTKYEIIGKTCEEVFPGGPNEALADDSSVVAAGEAELGRMSWVETTRGRTPVVVDKVPYKDIDGKVVGVVGFLQDVSELKRAEEELLSSLREKETLLKEIQHRVKNNLQVISSLIDLKSRKVENREALDILADIKSKVFTMATIHAMLFDADRFDRIDMGQFANKLVSHLVQVYRLEARITPAVSCSGVFLSMKQAMPCGLVINEIVSNAFKHAFKGRREGRLDISLARTDDGTVSVTVRDDGVGFAGPASVREGEAAGGRMGMKLAELIVREQLKGSMRTESDGGAVVEFVFPSPA